MPTGIVQFFLAEARYGYIRVPESREEFFFRGRDCRQPVRRGDRVRFRVEEDKQGVRAVEVEKADA